MLNSNRDARDAHDAHLEPRLSPKLASTPVMNKCCLIDFIQSIILRPMIIVCA